MKMGPKVIAILALIHIMAISSQVEGQIQLPFLPRQRRCRPYNSTAAPVNTPGELTACRREVASTRQIRVTDADKRTDEILRDNGFDLETHTITTQDNYILTVYRVAGSARSPRRAGKQSVLLYHGLGSSSDTWFVLPFNRTIVSMLVNAGYELWIPNGRGADFSQGHRTLNAQRDIAYWEFSFHEMGVYDLPAIVDYMLARTGNEKIVYIGHSQGGSSYLAGVSEVPSLNDKIHVSFLLAPAAFLGGAYMESMTMWLPALYTPLETILVNFFNGRMELREPRFIPFFGRDATDLCSLRAVQCDLCDNTFFTLFDFNPNQINYTNTPYFLRALNTASFRSMIHLGQNLVSCQFRKYDYGNPVDNRRRYGTVEPPSYALRNIRTPLHIYYGAEDELITPDDIQRLSGEFSQDVLRELYRVPENLFNHVDFYAARDADSLVYEPIINTMSQYLTSA